VNYPTIRQDGFEYIETKGGDENILLLHGLFGSLSNFDHLLAEFGDKYNFLIPLLPILTADKEDVGLDGLLRFIESFVDYIKYPKMHVLGNSLGGHLAQLFALAHPSKVKSLILTGSSGLYENPMGSSWPRRENYDYVKQKVETTFYEPQMATKEMIDQVYQIVNDRSKVIRIVITAKSAIRHNLADKLKQIKVPSLLVWGKQDEITPAFVAEKFEELLPEAQLVLIDECGHAAMMEKPTEFNAAFKQFLDGFISS